MTALHILSFAVTFQEPVCGVTHALTLRYTVSVINEARLIGNVQRFLNSNEPNFPDFVQTLVTHRFTSSE